jgi:hypothetical protein
LREESLGRSGRERLRTPSTAQTSSLTHRHVGRMRASQESNIGRWIDTVKRSHFRFARQSEVHSRPFFKSPRTPRPQCSPVRTAHRRQARGPIWNRAGIRPDTAAEEANLATFLRPRQHQTKSARHHNPEGRQHRDQPWPIVRHTSSPRDCLLSFGIVVGAGLPRPPRLTCQAHHEADGRKIQASFDFVYGIPGRV